MGTLLQDLHFARRSLLRHPLFTAVGVLTLALGIGLNTAVFSAIEALLLRPPAGIRAPEQIVQLYRTSPGGMQFGSNSVPHFRDVREHATDVFTDVAAWNFTPVNLSFGGRNERVFGLLASANFFSTLGVEMALGRGFVRDEDVGPGAHPVVVLGHATWQRSFGGDSSIVGRQVILNGRGYTVVGVTHRDFRGAMPVVNAALYVPLMQLPHIVPSSHDQLQARGDNFLNVVARLRPGVTAARASARLDAINRQLTEAYPDYYEGRGMLIVPQAQAGIHPMFRDSQVQLSAVVMIVVAMLLLIACVNVANLFLARASERSREMAVRLSIGASRGRLVRQLLTESVVFALVAGTVGLLIAGAAIGIANTIRLPMDIDMQPELRLSIPVLVFTFAVSLVVGMIFGLAPALQATRPALVPALKGEAPAGGSRSRLSAPLVVAQMALSLVLLVCSGLFLRNIREATTLEKGFDASNMLVGALDPSLQGYSRARGEQFYARLLERVRALPGVVGVGAIEDLPLGLSNRDSHVTVDGYTPAPDENMSIRNTIVSPGYFETMRIPVRKGRTFTARDDSAAAAVMIVNEHFVERFLPGRDPIGARVRMSGTDRVIVGVTSTGKYSSLGEPPTAFVWMPQAQEWRAGMYVVIRTAGDPSALIPALRAEVTALDAELPLADVKTMEGHLGIALLPSRVAGTALGVFGLLGLFLAAVGVYGVMSYSVAQRTREIGIRMAIGSSRGEVVGLVLRRGMRLVAMGLAIGLAGALAAARLVRGLLYGGGAADPMTIVMTTGVLVGVAVLATWIPARRAAGIDPILALRAE